MDQNLTQVMESRCRRTVKALRANHFDAHYIPTATELAAKLDELMPQGCSCSVGGSMTLFETGVIDYLKNGQIRYLDRYEPGADLERLFAEAACCDVYLTSANAVTEDGYLYNMDGRGNRVAAICKGPGKVIVIAGCNKIVTNLEMARDRLRKIAAPANNIRLNTGNPCTKTGVCMDCRGPGRICVQELVTGPQRDDRITVLMLGEAYGY